MNDRGSALTARSCLRAASALALLLPIAGCCGSTSYPVCNGSTAAVSISAPAALGLGTTLLLNSVQSCLDSKGDCSAMPRFTMQTDLIGQSTTGVLVLDVAFPETAGGMTLTLPSSEVVVTAGFGRHGATEKEIPVSGTLGIEAVSPAGFRVSLQFQLDTGDGETIILSGPVEASGCGIQHIDRSCSPIT